MPRLQLPMAPATGPPIRTHISFSSISTYQTCPLRYYFRYEIGLAEKKVPANLVLGGAIHAAVQAHFEHWLAGSTADLDALLAAFWEAWNARDDQMIVHARGEDINTIGKLAERMLRAFQRSSFSRPAGSIIAVEEELQGKLMEGLPGLLARVDLIEDAGDALVVTDLKTARNAWSVDHVLDAALQLWLYSHLVEEMADGRPIRLQFAVLTKAAIPEVVIHPVPNGQERLRRAVKIVEWIWRAIKAGNFYPAPSPAACPSCPYREPCRAWPG